MHTALLFVIMMSISIGSSSFVTHPERLTLISDAPPVLTEDAGWITIRPPSAHRPITGDSLLRLMRRANLSPLTAPVTVTDLWRFPTSSLYCGPAQTDRCVIRCDDGGWEIRWAFFTATLGRDTLCVDLLGSDADLALGSLGYHDQSPYELSVTVLVTRTGRLGHPTDVVNVVGPMPKEDFDRIEATWAANPTPPFAPVVPTIPR